LVAEIARAAGDQFRQVTVDHVLAVAFRERNGVAGLDGALTSRVNVVKDTIGLAKLGDEGHVHAEVPTHGTQ
jgi:hypothetical protein